MDKEQIDNETLERAFTSGYVEGIYRKDDKKWPDVFDVFRKWVKDGMPEPPDNA